MSDNNYKAMVAISVEVVLMRKGGPQYQLVLARLERDHDAKIFDCFEHPEYLRDVLIDVYGKEYEDVVSRIESELGEVLSAGEVTRFLDVLKRPR